MSTARYLKFAYAQDNLLHLPVGNTADGKMKLCWDCKKLTYQDHLKAQARMAERAKAKREAVTMVPTFAVKRKNEKSEKGQKRWMGAK